PDYLVKAHAVIVRTPCSDNRLPIPPWHPGRPPSDRLADAPDYLFIRGIWRFQRRPQWQRHLVHAVYRARRADAGGGGGDVHPRQAAGVSDFGVEDDG